MPRTGFKMTKSLLLTFFCIAIGITSCNVSQTAPETREAKSEAATEASVIGKLAAAQLAAYNQADLDAFCACYHPEVRVFDGETEKPPGIEAFRKRYVDMFATGGFGASAPTRVIHGKHCVDLEHWWRDGGKSGKVLVRYTEKDGLIGVVQFLK